MKDQVLTSAELHGKPPPLPFLGHALAMVGERMLWREPGLNFAERTDFAEAVILATVVYVESDLDAFTDDYTDRVRRTDRHGAKLSAAAVLRRMDTLFVVLRQPEDIAGWRLGDVVHVENPRDDLSDIP
jgi:hypothetical protein